MAVYWGAAWLVGEDVQPGATALAVAVVAVPTLLVSAATVPRRVATALAGAIRPPRATIHETAASSRERRLRLMGVVLTGIVALLFVDRLAGLSGVMAGLIVGMLGSLALVDRLEARRWEAAEQERESRIFVLVKPDGLTPPPAASRVYELVRRGTGDGLGAEPSPFDLEI